MILSALNSYYQRLAERSQVPPFGYSDERISYAIVLSTNGTVLDVNDIQSHSGTRPIPAYRWVPSLLEERTSGIKPHFLWDKSSYVLGVTEKENNCTEKHSSFKKMHIQILGDEADIGLRAICLFLAKWSPEQFQSAHFSDDMRDKNFVFRLDGEKGYLHERPASMAAWQGVLTQVETTTGQCLVSGELNSSLARVHPKIKGVDGGQSSGTSIVSFNDDAYVSYRGQKNDTGANSPISVSAAFGYVTALKHLLRQSNKNRQRLKIGDATVVFWAVAATPEKVSSAELTFSNMLNPPTDDAKASARLRTILDKVAAGRPLQEIDTALDPDTKIYVLGLAPNASRLSIRFWETGSLEMFAQRLAEHYKDLWLDPPPWKTPPSILRLIYATAPSRDGKAKAENIPPNLAGELTRAILVGQRYPRSLLTNIVMRLRADGDITGIRVALCKAVLARDLRLGVKGINEEIPMSLNRESSSPGYRLGRLFAELENIQRAALGGSVNATIRDRFFGAASATPASVFPILLRNTQHHLSRLRKDKPGLAHSLEKEIGEIVDGLDTHFPRNLRIEDQGRFAIGYYHQSQSRFAAKNGANVNRNELGEKEKTE